MSFKSCISCLYASISHNTKRCSVCHSHDKYLPVKNENFYINKKCTCLISPKDKKICLKCKKFLELK
jgi:hypothetical protein